jgi:DNA-binding LacI/PurR family transcriptional regulator
MPPVSIIDIARLAQVSPSTVSRALQDNPRISPERRAEIQALADRLGYRPSQVARGLVTGRTHTFGVVASDVTDPFVAEVLKGVEAAAREAGYGVLIAMSNRNPAEEIEAAEVLLDHQVDGLIVISSRAPDRYARLSRNAADRVPLVLLNNQQPGPNIFSVRMDNEAGAREAVTYLHALGHRRIGFVAGPENGRSSRERLSGYRQGIAACGLDAVDELIQQGAGLPEDGRAALDAFLRLPDAPSAVLCYNDLSAIGLLAAAARVGARVPDDLSVVGYDNIPLSAYAAPPLTTVEQPKAAMGRAAIEVCLAALAGAPIRERVLTGQLVIRESAISCALT